MRYPIAKAVSLAVRQPDAQPSPTDAEELPPLTRRWPRIAGQAGDAAATGREVPARTASSKPATAR
jgi:hypothetical protein